MKTAVALVGLVLISMAPAGVSAQGQVLKPTVLAPNPFAMTPPPAPITPQPDQSAPVRPPHRHHRPAPVVVTPCCVTGYWTYQWVPTAYTTYVWVPGYVTEAGVLMGGGYQPQVVTGGYYQQVWVGY
ncbi:MAG TPA: hypothetical protein VID28_03625 [Methylomirabilota bacterium]|jgi:hypothetical protein